MKPQGTKRKPRIGPEVPPPPVKRREQRIEKPRRITLKPDEGKQQQAD